MAEEQAKKATPSGPAPAAGPSAAARAVTMLLPALIAGLAAFGGARFGTPARAADGKAGEAPAPPGPTVPLDPFLVTLQSGQVPHVLKMTMVLELKKGENPDTIKALVPHIRDATLSYLRSLRFEEAASNDHQEAMRAKLRERCAALGAPVERVLITDFVTQ